MAFRTRGTLFGSKKALFSQGSLENFHVFEVKWRLFILPPKPVFREHLININRDRFFLPKANLIQRKKTLFLPKIKRR